MSPSRLISNIHNKQIHIPRFEIDTVDLVAMAHRLTAELSFSPELAAQITSPANAESAFIILHLKDTGFKFCDEDPLLVISTDVSDPSSGLYANGGNYALTVGAPGFAPWPPGTDFFAAQIFILCFQVGQYSHHQFKLQPEMRLL